MRTKLPDFLIIGAPKAGTTSLYKYLQRHPSIFMPKKKEPHFFSFEGRTTGFNGPGQAKFVEKRVTRFEDYASLFKSADDDAVIGEASTSYLYIPEAAARIKHYLPNAKIIAILRHPVDRAFSHYLHHFRNGGETLLNFTEAIAAEDFRQKQGWSPFWQYTAIGFYYQHLKRYFDLFGSESIKICLYDDFASDSSKVIQDIFSFVGARPDLYGLGMDETRYNPSTIRVEYRSPFVHRLIHRESQLKTLARELLPSGVRNRIRNYLSERNKVHVEKPYKPTLSATVRAELTKKYRQDIMSLQKLINRDLTHWLEH